MDADKLFDAIGNIGGDLILDARQNVKRRRIWPRVLAAAACIVLAMTVFLRTEPGRAFADYIEDLITRLFPPVETGLVIEGLVDDVTMNPHGVAGGQDSSGQYADYVIYIEDNQYDIEQGENYLRASSPKSENPNLQHLPETYLEIVQIPGKTVDEAADEITRAEARSGEFYKVGCQVPTEDFPYMVLSYRDGYEWDSCLRNYYLRDNGKGGVFKITSQYFFEAAEGTGSRFAYYISTLEIIDGADSATVSP